MNSGLLLQCIDAQVRVFFLLQRYFTTTLNPLSCHRLHSSGNPYGVAPQLARKSFNTPSVHMKINSKL